MAFNLDSISKTKRATAPKIVIYGPSKVGKSTFAASAPASVGILTEDGCSALDTEAFPVAQNLGEVYAAIGSLLQDPHEFKSVFLDSLDWLEPLVHAHVCAANNWASIESPGFGKGYVAAAEEWRNLLSGFDALRDQRNMTVILIAHDKIKRFESPMHDGYDVYNLKLQDRASAIVQEWADIIGFCGYKVMTKASDAGFGNKETKAITTGERLLHLEAHPAHVGGNRFSLKNCPLNFEKFIEQLTEQTTTKKGKK